MSAFSDDCGKVLTAEDMKTLQAIARGYVKRACATVPCEKCRAELLYAFLGAVSVEAAAAGEPTMQLFFSRGAAESAEHRHRLDAAKSLVADLLRGDS